MDLDHILKNVRSGDLDLEEAKLQILQIEQMSQRNVDLGFANVDIDREKRTGFPEVIFGEGKTPEQIIAIFSKLMQHSDRVMATRVDSQKAAIVTAALPEATYHTAARVLTWFSKPIHKVTDGYIALICAGTSDLPVAEEAAITIECAGSHVERIYDVGVAGIHRLFNNLPLIRGASV
jgi:NCAIR mutase (PurE)-related protein